ncbi:MAG: hypothetical protein KGN84_13020 [Acidobacteriota bacterium]|nr:hypothetical protein [Acidobacteriota bacterium]
MRTRYCLFALTLAASLAVSSGCRGRHQRTAVQNEEPPAPAVRQIESTVKMSDPAAQAQLIKGIYGIEVGSWRWTAGHFSILLRPPLGSAQSGATLSLALTVPEVIFRKLGPLTLTASAGGTRIKTEKYAKSGSYTFGADVPGSLLAGDSVTFDFDLDKSLPPTGSDSRELGLIVSAVSLESK